MGGGGAYLPFLLLTELEPGVCVLVAASVVEAVVIIAGGGGLSVQRIRL